jgi:hypothetical protein
MLGLLIALRLILRRSATDRDCGQYEQRVRLHSYSQAKSADGRA